MTYLHVLMVSSDPGLRRNVSLVEVEAGSVGQELVMLLEDLLEPSIIQITVPESVSWLVQVEERSGSLNELTSPSTPHSR